MRVRENVTIQDDAGGVVRYSAGDTVDEAHERFITNPNVIENDRLDALDHVGTLVLIEIARLLGIDDWASAARDGLCEQIAARDDAVDVITMVISRFVDEGRQVERVDASDTGLQVVEPAQTYPSGYDEQPEPEGEPVVIDVDLSEHAQMPGTDAPGPETPTPTTETINVDADVIRSSVAAFIRAWNRDPARLADQQLNLTSQVRDRLTAAASARHWETLASRIDPRLVADPHWRNLASTLQDARARRVDVPNAISVALEDGPLNSATPASELAGRLERLTYPEPFAETPDGAVADQPADELRTNSRPHPDRGTVSW